MTNRGFTLLEIAVVLMLVGLMTAAGLIFLPQLWKEKQRVETRKYLLAAKRALISYASNYNALPVHEDADNILLPIATLKLREKDPFDHSLRYIVNSKLLLDTTLGADKTLPCSTLKDYFASGTVADFPFLWQQGMPEVAGSSIAMAVVLLSRGADGELGRRWIDSNSNGVTDVGETIIGDNNTNDLVQAPPSESFDDLVAYITIPELMNALPECR